MEYSIHTFPNGIRVIHKQVKSTKIAHCGIILNIGSRDEKPHQQGIAHFWEHMAFKGTTRRKAFHILNRLDSVGGEINAYTTKDKICFYASALEEHFDKSAELVADISFHSVFPEKEIIKERGVILEEMSMYLDDPADAIADEFDEVVYKNHQLGKNILGDKESVMRFTQQDFFDFIDENLSTDEVVFSSVSSLPMSKVVKVAEKYFSKIPANTFPRQRVPFTGYEPEFRQQVKSISQAHCILGGEAYSFHDDKRLPFFLLTNMLGGPGMNSRLSLQIREKYGYVYDIASSYTSFEDTGLHTIYFATEEKTLNRCINLVEKELRKICDQPLGIRQLHTAKQQLMGQIAMGEESNLSMMLGMGKSLLNKDDLEPLEVLFNKIESITAQQIMDVANETMTHDKLSTLIYFPKAAE
ncbi:pitrilysin family protein [Limibacter armeniacum]|uniref:M16 family metallopeptidase n=1 Tax=Limibacter armeniacum TaxID=466084 RepID=UPI002FE52F45